MALTLNDVAQVMEPLLRALRNEWQRNDALYQALTHSAPLRTIDPNKRLEPGL